VSTQSSARSSGRTGIHLMRRINIATLGDG
jgi:hypothetical protein